MLFRCSSPATVNPSCALGAGNGAAPSPAHPQALVRSVLEHAGPTRRLRRLETALGARQRHVPQVAFASESIPDVYRRHAWGGLVRMSVTLTMAAVLTSVRTGRGPPRLRANDLVRLTGWPFQVGGGARNTGTPISRMLARGHPGIFRRRTPSSGPGASSPGDIPASSDAGHPRLVLDSSAPEKVMHFESNLEIGTPKEPPRHGTPHKLPLV